MGDTGNVGDTGEVGESGVVGLAAPSVGEQGGNSGHSSSSSSCSQVGSCGHRHGGCTAVPPSHCCHPSRCCHFTLQPTRTLCHPQPQVCHSTHSGATPTPPVPPSTQPLAVSPQLCLLSPAGLGCCPLPPAWARARPPPVALHCLWPALQPRAQQPALLQAPCQHPLQSQPRSQKPLLPWLHSQHPLQPPP